MRGRPSDGSGPRSGEFLLDRVMTLIGNRLRLRRMHWLSSDAEGEGQWGGRGKESVLIVGRTRNQNEMVALLEDSLDLGIHQVPDTMIRAASETSRV